MPKPRKEQYRVTITRPEAMKDSEVKKLIIDGFILAQMDAKVELIRGGVEELPPPPSLSPFSLKIWKRVFG